MDNRDLLAKFENYTPCRKQEELFFAKLMEENSWSLDFTRDAVSEYLKFLKIVKVFGVSQTPSKIIDEVWHMHLQFTKDYWENLCPNVLGFNLHHIPSPQDMESDTKNARQYEKTLEYYRELFGEPVDRFWGGKKDTKLYAKQDKYNTKTFVCAFSILFLVLSMGSPGFSFLSSISGHSFLILYGVLTVIVNLIVALIILYLLEQNKKSLAVVSINIASTILFLIALLRIFHGINNGFPVLFLSLEAFIAVFVTQLQRHVLYPSNNINKNCDLGSGSCSTSPGSSCSSSACSSSCGGCGGGD